MQETYAKARFTRFLFALVLKDKMLFALITFFNFISLFSQLEIIQNVESETAPFIK